MKIVTIGRSSTNNINVNDSLVSRVHCQIIQENDGSFTLSDSGSKNGTYVNGVKRHGQVKLNPNDIIRIGNSTLPWQSYFIGGNDCPPTSGGTVIGSNNGGYQPPMPPMEKPNNYLVWAILGTIFCCLPFGIVSIVYASKVDGLWLTGNYFAATEAARKAKTWFWWSFGIGLTANIIVLIYYICVAVIGLSAF